MKSPLPILASILLLALASACSDPSPEARLKAAEEELVAANQSLEQASTVRDRAQNAFDAAEQTLADADEAVEAAEARVAEAEAEVALHATDDVLFRTVQKKLLEDGPLSNLAISASVTGGVVTLRGDVPDEEARARAVSIAEDVPGVRTVEDRLTLPRPSVAAPPTEEPATGL